MASRRGIPTDQFAELGIPDLGMDTDTVPRLLSPRKASLLTNFLMDRPGVLPMRGPICEGTTWNLGASIGLYGAWMFNDKLLVSSFAASGTATRDYWVSRYRKDFSAPGSLLRKGSTALKLVDLSAGTVTNVTATTREQIPGLRSVRSNNFLYGIAGDCLDADVSGDDENAKHRNTRILRWDGSAVSPFSYGTNAPIGCVDITIHYNRLFALGGIALDGSGTGYQHSTLQWSDFLPADGAGLPVSVNAWKDDVSGLWNQLVVGARESDFGVALAHVGQNLLILKRRSLWMLYGTAPANFQVKQASNEVGCIDPRSVVEYNGGAYFMSERGFMFYDGQAAPRPVSVGLENTLVANALKQVGPQGVDGGYCRAALLDRGYILVTTGRVDGTTLAATADTDAWLLHAPSGAWLQLSSGALPSILIGGRTVNNTYLLTDQKLVKSNYLFAPQNAPAGTRGFDSIDSGASKFVIPSRWTTRALSLAAPTRKSKLQRITADYYWGLANGGWQVTTNTRGATGVVNSVGTLAAPTGIAASLPARGAIDIFNETDEVYMDIAASSGAPAAFNDAELHRILIESESTANVPASL
jgi:hypothetical protein